MEFSRRTFLKGTVLGGAGFSALGFDLAPAQKADVTVDAADTLVLNGVNGSAMGIAGALRFEARARVLARGGRKEVKADSVAVEGADSAVLLIAAATSYKNYQDTSGDPSAVVREEISRAGRKDFGALLEAHIADYQGLFRRVQLDLGSTAAVQWPTDKRIRNFNNGNDPQLAALFNAARLFNARSAFAIVAASPDRPGSQEVSTVTGVRLYPLRPGRRRLADELGVGHPRHLVVYRLGGDGAV